MQKLLLLSGLMAVVIIPALAARDPLPRRGLRKAALTYFTFNMAWLLGLLYLYWRFARE